MFYLSIETQKQFDAANKYIFDEELSEEFIQDTYDDFFEFEDVLPSHFFEAIQQKSLFHDELLMPQFEQWCDEVKHHYNEKRKKVYEENEGIYPKLHPSAQELMKHSFHDGEILKAELNGDNFTLLLDMSGGFLPHAFIELTFHHAHFEGELKGYYIYDELIETNNGFALRILSSYGYPYAESTIYFKDVSIHGVYRPAVYMEPGDVSTWEGFVARLNPTFDYFTMQDHAFIPINLDQIVETENGILAGSIKLGNNYEEARGRILCAQYEDPYAHLSEPIAINNLYDAVFSEDQTLKVRALNTMFALGEEVAPIVQRVLSEATMTEKNEMYFFVLANHFYQLGLLDEALYEKWK